MDIDVGSLKSMGLLGANDEIESLEDLASLWLYKHEDPHGICFDYDEESVDIEHFIWWALEACGDNSLISDYFVKRNDEGYVESLKYQKNGEEVKIRFSELSTRISTEQIDHIVNLIEANSDWKIVQPNNGSDWLEYLCLPKSVLISESKETSIIDLKQVKSKSDLKGISDHQLGRLCSELVTLNLEQQSSEKLKEIECAQKLIISKANSSYTKYRALKKVCSLADDIVYERQDHDLSSVIDQALALADLGISLLCPADSFQCAYPPDLYVGKWIAMHHIASSRKRYASETNPLSECYDLFEDYFERPLTDSEREDAEYWSAYYIERLRKGKELFGWYNITSL